MREGWLITRTLIYRQRIGLSVAIGLLALMSGALLLLRNTHISETFLFCGSCTMVVTFLFIFAAFIQTDADVLSPRSSFPAHFFTLPVSTSNLVMGPIAASVLIMGAVSYLFILALNAAGFPVNALGVAATVVACLTSLQAVFWSPMPVPYIRLALAIFSMSFVPYMWVLGLASGASELTMIYVFLGVSLVCALLSVAGVSSARLGAGLTTGTKYRARERRAVREKEPFRSPMAAQVWYEWRQHGRILPILVTAGVLFFLLAKYLVDTTSTGVAPANLGAGQSYPNYSTFVRTFIYTALAAPPIMAWIIGLGMRKSDLQAGKRTLHVFFATRPISDRNVFTAKVRAAIKSSLVAWGVMLVGGLCLAIFTYGYVTTFVAQNLPMAHGGVQKVLVPHQGPPVVMGSLILRFWDWPGACYCASFALLAIGFTVRNYVSGLWIELSGLYELRYLYAFLTMVALAVWALIDSRLATLSRIVFDRYNTSFRCRR